MTSNIVTARNTYISELMFNLCIFQPMIKSGMVSHIRTSITTPMETSILSLKTKKASMNMETAVWVTVMLKRLRRLGRRRDERSVMLELGRGG